MLAAERMIEIHREIVKLDDDAVRTSQEMFNVGQAGEPEVIQARVQERRAQGGASEGGESIPRRLGRAGRRSSVRPSSGRRRWI